MNPRANDIRQTLDYTQRWLRDNQDKYRIQRTDLKQFDQDDKKEIDRLNRFYPNGFHFVDTIRADGKILWLTREVVGGKLKVQRREIATLEEFKKEFLKAKINKEASIEVHVRAVRTEGATERAQAILKFIQDEGYKKAGPVSN